MNQVTKFIFIVLEYIVKFGDCFVSSFCFLRTVGSLAKQKKKLIAVFSENQKIEENQDFTINGKRKQCSNKPEMIDQRTHRSNQELTVM